MMKKLSTVFKDYTLSALFYIHIIMYVAYQDKALSATCGCPRQSNLVHILIEDLQQSVEVCL